MKTVLSYEIFSKIFKNKISKNAYMDCLKWLAINVYSKEEISKNVSVKIEKQKTKIPTFKLTIFVDIDTGNIKGRFCDKCKNIYASFYQVEKMNCLECKVNAYIKNSNSYCSGIVKIYKKIFEELEND
jgi:hypothetical protein